MCGSCFSVFSVNIGQGGQFLEPNAHFLFINPTKNKICIPYKYLIELFLVEIQWEIQYKNDESPLLTKENENKDKEKTFLK